jgi:hypothetical protein
LHPLPLPVERTDDPVSCSALVGYVVEVLTVDGSTIDLVIDEVTELELLGRMWSPRGRDETCLERRIPRKEVLRVREWL